MQLDHYAQHARRAATGTSILDVGSWIALLAGGIFWFNFFWIIIVPAQIVEVALAVAMALAYALVLPILLSTLVPSTPAGMLLQQTKWRTFGFGATIVAVLYLSYHAFEVLLAWWSSRKAATDTGQELYLAIGSLIVFVLIPALAWVQAAPDRWVAEVQAAMAVRRLKLAQEANIMAMKTQYIRSISLLRRGVANLTVQEADELAGTLVAFQRAENEALGQVVDSLEVITGISTGVRLAEDDELSQAYTGITTKLRGLIAAPNVADYVEMPPATRVGIAGPPVWDGAESPAAETPHQNAPEPVEVRTAAATAARATVAQGDARRATVAHSGARPYGEHYDTARAALTERTWTVKQLAAVFNVSDSQAREMRAAWQEAGLVDKTNLNGHYCWKEA